MASEDVIARKLLELGASPELANRVARLVQLVSYSKEVKARSQPESEIEYLKVFTDNPELAIVQDADRLDAIGAIGIARTFAFAGARGNPLYGEGKKACLKHFDDKLLHLESLMKTGSGRECARTRTERLRTFKEWMIEEMQGL